MMNRLKHIFICLTLLSATFHMFAEDLIIKTDGTTLKVYNVEVGEKSIIYTEEDSDDAPIKKISLSECFAVKIGDGPMTNIGQQNTNSDNAGQPQPQVAASDGPTQIEAVPADNNRQLIDAYNSVTFSHKNKDTNDKKIVLTNDAIALLGITDWSILSDKNIEVSFEIVPTFRTELENYWDIEMELNSVGMLYYVANYKIKIRNKTDRNIYIDLPSSFRIKSDGTTESFFNNMTISSSSGSSVGVGLGLGVGIGSSSSTTITQTENPILTIPPHGTATLPQRIIVHKNGKKFIKNYDIFDPGHRGVTKEGLPLEKWRMTDLGDRLEDQAEQRLIVYSTSPDFNTYTSLRFGVYIRALYGTSDSARRKLRDKDYIIDGDVYPLWVTVWIPNK